MTSYKHQNLCFYCKRFNHRQDECRTRIQDNQPCTNSRGRKYWRKRYTDEEMTQGSASPVSARTNYVTPLMGSRSVLPQLILNLCLALLTTCNKLYEIFVPGEKVRPRINVKTGNQTTSWLFDTGAAITCMNSQSLNAAFGNQRPRKISNAQSCVAASGDTMNSKGVYEVDLWIKGQKFTHPVNVITELNDNIIGIDFMHCNKLIYDINMRQVKFADAKMNTICMTKQVIIPAMTSSIITTKFNGKTHPDKAYAATIHCPGAPTLTGVPSLVSINSNQNCKIIIENCAPYEVTIERTDIMGIIEIKEDEMYPLTDKAMADICAAIKSNIPSTPRNRLTRDDIAKRCHLQAPEEFKDRYLDILFKHQDAISMDKYDLGLARNYKHRIHLKNKNPVYQKQFKIPEAHHNFIEQTLEEWLKLGVVRRSDSLYNLPIFCVLKKQGQGLQIVQDFRELNQNSHIDKYSMKEITECISHIGQANFNIFSTLDLTSGFWQMKLDEKSQSLAAFTIPGKGQLHWITSPMGLLGCPASFQCLMEGVLRNLQNVIVYIDDLLIHSDTHERRLQSLEQVLERLHQNYLKINLEKCIFGNKEVSYLGFTLTPEGIKPGKNKLKVIQMAKAPADIKTIRSFVGLCNFFQTHIKDFAIITAPLFRLTQKDSRYKGGPLPQPAMDAFINL
jgi:hypothetical protein